MKDQEEMMLRDPLDTYMNVFYPQSNDSEFTSLSKYESVSMTSPAKEKYLQSDQSVSTQMLAPLQKQLDLLKSSVSVCVSKIAEPEQAADQILNFNQSLKN